MKKIFLGSVALLALSAAPAAAADLAARPYTKAPPPMVAPIYNWGGFYIGGNGGYGTSRKCWDLTRLPVAGVPTAFGPVAEGCHDADGATAGGQIGYRWQAGQFVYGLEGQGNWADFRGSNISAFNAAFTNRSRVDAFGLITGQIGYGWNNVLLYAKGGAAVVGTRYDVVTTAGGVLAATSNSNSRWGATVGAGLEVGFAPNWSVGVEYNHIFLGTESRDFGSTGAVAGTGAAGAFFATDRIRGDIDMVTARINYRWGGPVVARY